MPKGRIKWIKLFWQLATGGKRPCLNVALHTSTVHTHTLLNYQFAKQTLQEFHSK